MQLVQDAVASNDTSANNSARVTVASSAQSWQIDCTGPNVEPAFRRQSLSPSSSLYESRIGDGMSPLHQALVMYQRQLEHKALGVELLENATRLDPGETDFPASSCEWNFRALSSQHHYVGPLPVSAAPPSPSEQKQREEFRSTVEPRRPISPHSQLQLARSVAESGHEGAETEHKSFCRVVNYLLV